MCVLKMGKGEGKPSRKVGYYTKANSWYHEEEKPIRN